MKTESNNNAEERTENESTLQNGSPEQHPIQAEGGRQRKKYHSSALYAASLWHTSVGHVKPFHKGIDL